MWKPGRHSDSPKFLQLLSRQPGSPNDSEPSMPLRIDCLERQYLDCSCLRHPELRSQGWCSDKGHTQFWSAARPLSPRPVFCAQPPGWWTPAQELMDRRNGGSERWRGTVCFEGTSAALAYPLEREWHGWQSPNFGSGKHWARHLLCDVGQLNLKKPHFSQLQNGLKIVPCWVIEV